MLLNSHLDIQPNELTHMSVSERILSSENWTNFEYTLEITHNTHLLIKLRRLSKACFFTEILKTEDIGATLRTTSYQFRGMDFDEVIISQEFSEDLAYSRWNSENSLLSCCSEIDDSVVKSSFHFNDCLLWLFFSLFVLLFFMFFFFMFLLLVLLLFLLLLGLLLLFKIELVWSDFSASIQKL